jgi:hypothetical protein
MPNNGTSLLLRYGRAAKNTPLAMWVRLLLDPALGDRFAWAAVILDALFADHFVMPPRRRITPHHPDYQ